MSATDSAPTSPQAEEPTTEPVADVTPPSRNTRQARNVQLQHGGRPADLDPDTPPPAKRRGRGRQGKVKTTKKAAAVKRNAIEVEVDDEETETQAAEEDEEEPAEAVPETEPEPPQPVFVSLETVLNRSRERIAEKERVARSEQLDNR